MNTEETLRAFAADSLMNAPGRAILALKNAILKHKITIPELEIEVSVLVIMISSPGTAISIPVIVISWREIPISKDKIAIAKPEITIPKPEIAIPIANCNWVDTNGSVLPAVAGGFWLHETHPLPQVVLTRAHSFRLHPFASRYKERILIP